MKNNQLTFANWPYFAEDEINAVAQTLRSGKVNYWTGDECTVFENKFAEFCGVNHAIAVCNGTVALELALYALNIDAGDEVIVTPRTFMASASAIIRQKAIPVFADVDLDSQNITAESIAAVITNKTKAIIVVHLAGWPCDMPAIMDLAKKHGLYVVEDCAQALGATINGKMVGGFGDIAAFSFCQDKIMTTGGEGGMVTTNDAELFKNMWSFKDHGKNYILACSNNKIGVGFKWLIDSFGTNFRLSGIQAAIGLKQLEKMQTWLLKRRTNASLLNVGFKKISGLRLTIPASNIEHSYYKYYCFLEPEILKKTKDKNIVIEKINKQGVPCFWGSCSEIYLEQAFANVIPTDFPRLPNAKLLGETSLMFPVHPTLTNIHMHKIVEVVCEEIQNILK